MPFGEPIPTSHNLRIFQEFLIQFRNSENLRIAWLTGLQNNGVSCLLCLHVANGKRKFAVFHECSLSDVAKPSRTDTVTNTDWISLRTCVFFQVHFQCCSLHEKTVKLSFLSLKNVSGANITCVSQTPESCLVPMQVMGRRLKETQHSIG